MKHLKSIKVLLLILLPVLSMAQVVPMSFIQKKVSSRPLDGQTAATAGTSAYQIKTDYPTSSDGVYWIKNVNINAGTPFQINADMTTDGGGWTLILNYLHFGGTNPALTVKTASLPLIGSTTLGTDESASSTTWGHASSAMLNALDFTTVRFYGKTSSHSRIIHFKTSLSNVVSYMKAGSGDFSNIQNAANYTLLLGHTANIPASASKFYANKGDLSITEFPFYTSGNTSRNYHWGIKGQSGRWEVDDYPNDDTQNNYHQIWVR